MSHTPHQLILFGAGGHARSVANIASRLVWVRDIAFVDSQQYASGLREMLGFPVFAFADAAMKASDATSGFHLAIGNSAVRERLANELAKSHAEVPFLSVIADSAHIGLEAEIEDGSFVGDGAHIGPRAVIGAHSLINTHAVVEHDVRVGAFSHISVNATIAGTAYLGARCMVGAGAVVRDGLRIADGVTLGAGAVATSPIEKAGTYVGLPAKLLAE